MRLKESLLIGLFGFSSAGCASIFNAMTRDFTAERSVVGQARQQAQPEEINVISYNLGTAGALMISMETMPEWMS